MGTTGRPPCDEAAILSGSCDRPAATAGPWILAATILGSSMAFIDGTVVNVALPALQADLHATLADVQWVVEAYALLLASLLLIGGTLGDRYGRRRVFGAGIVVFSLASAWCGLAPNIRQLVAARSLQGIGGALLVPGSLALISANFSQKERGRAIGTWSGFTSITAAIGPVMGGWFTEHGSWRWVFYINIPLALAVLILIVWKVPESKGGGTGLPFDWLGGILTAAGFGGIVFALIESAAGWGAGGAIALIGLIYWEGHSRAPMIPLHLFRSRNFSGSEPGHALSVLRAERSAVLLPAGPDPSTGLFGDRGGDGPAALHIVDVSNYPAGLADWWIDTGYAKAPLVTRSAGCRPRSASRCLRSKVSAAPTGRLFSRQLWCWDSAWQSAWHR